MNVNDIRLYCCYIYCSKVNDPSSMLCTAIKELNGIYKQSNYQDASYCLCQLKEMLSTLENYEFMMRAFGIMFERFEDYLFDTAKSFEEFRDSNQEPLRFIDD